jgi:beta-mannosidase
VHVAIDAAMSEWRRPGSACSGALVFLLRDLWEGAGWGVLDAAGRPKSAFHAMARACAPTALLLTDEGLNGLVAHVVHDRPVPFAGALHARLFGTDGGVIAEAERAVEVPAHGAVVESVDALFDAFRDLTYTYRFGPARYDVVSVQLRDDARVVSEAHYLPGGHRRPVVDDLGLRATGRAVGDQVEVHVQSDRFAHFVSLDVPGYVPDTSWFHVAPGDTRTVTLLPEPGAKAPSGEIRALNLSGSRTVQFGRADG